MTGRHHHITSAWGESKKSQDSKHHLLQRTYDIVRICMGAIPSLSWNGHRSLLSRVLELINMMYVLLLPTETPSNNDHDDDGSCNGACLHRNRMEPW
jgi:hypothetical protein